MSETPATPSYVFILLYPNILYSFLYFSFSYAYKSGNPKHEICTTTAQALQAVMELAVTPKQ